MNGMATEHIRRWFAERDGWIRHEEPFSFVNHDHEKFFAMGFLECRVRGGNIVYWTHPVEQPVMGEDVPGGYWHGLDRAARAMPEGWTWVRMDQDDHKWWAAFPKAWDGEEYPVVEDTNDEIHDRYLLAKLAIEAQEKAQ